MRLAVVLAALIVPSAAAASPAPMVGLVEWLATWSPAPPAPDLSVLAVEPVGDSESSGFGWREDPIRKRERFHHGTDYRAKPGTPVMAAGAGVVTFAGRRGGYGKLVIVDHGNGVVTRYAHLRVIETERGAHVAAGDRVGQVGSTGRTTGPHLHFEVRIDGRAVDPNTALVVAEIARENPAAGRLAAYALAPELQALARDRHDPKNQREARPERPRARERQLALW